MVEHKLNENGIHRYEVSNFAKTGSEALHNSNYWEHKNYLGLGPGAHSFRWDESRKTAQRWENEADLKKYLQTMEFDVPSKESLSLENLAEERIMLGLRTTKGILLNDLEATYDYSLSEQQIACIVQKASEGKILFDENAVRLTSAGLKIADALTLDILTA